jgi:hypothetical protein
MDEDEDETKTFWEYVDRGRATAWHARDAEVAALTAERDSLRRQLQEAKAIVASIDQARNGPGDVRFRMLAIHRIMESLNFNAPPLNESKP